MTAMFPDMATLTIDEARAGVTELLGQLMQAQEELATARRRASGLQKIIDGLHEWYPETKEIRP